MYSASLGEFLSRDPLPVNGQPDLLYDNNSFGDWLAAVHNLYGYTSNNPTNRGDPSGLKSCGPDVTDWLLKQMSTNKDHPVIKAARENRWPRYVPFFNIGWTAGAFYDFKQLVQAGGPWDFKSNQTFTAGRCPSQCCSSTVTLCGACVHEDVPGNIHYGWVGRQAEFAPWVLYAGGDYAAKGFRDDAWDKVAIGLGMNMVDTGASLCASVVTLLPQLNTQGTDGCSPCSTTY